MASPQEERARRVCDALGLEFRRLEPDTQKLWVAWPGTHFAAGVAAFVWQSVEKLVVPVQEVSV